MPTQFIFKRYEYKFLVSDEQKKLLLDAISKHLQPDKYGSTTIRNIYFDTNTYLLIRRSIEKPVYKEKLRIRTYAKANSNSPVFVELKKKYKSLVYKRRITVPEEQAMAWICNNERSVQTQIANEIDYFINFYKNLRPTVFLCYDRVAYTSPDESGFRVTFDNNILCRQNDLSLQSDAYGTPILPDDMSIMEIKCSGGIPLWMTSLLSKHNIYKTSFSKYGTAYKNLIFSEVNKNA